MRSIVATWSSMGMYSYGLAVPFISAYMLWAKLGELKTLRRAPDYVPGALTVLVGLSLLVVGQIATLDSIQQISLVVTLLGGVLLVIGRNGLKLTWFPIAYLLIGVPVWDHVIARLQVPSQLLSARISIVFLRLSSIPAVQDGTLVALPNVTLEVLPACSGVNQLISVVAMTLPAAYMWLQGYWRRFTLVGVAVLIAYLSNGFRIALVGFLAYHGWANSNLETLHLGEGLIVSLLGYGLIMLCLSVLARSGRGDSVGSMKPSSPDLSRIAVASASSYRWADVGLVLLLATAGTMLYTFKPTPVLSKQELLAFPKQIDDWDAVAAAGSESISRVAGADDELARTYQNTAGETIRLYIGYQTYQTQGKELPDPTNQESHASPAAVSQVELPLGSQTVQVNQMLVKKAGKEAVTIFWYDLNGRIVASRYRAKGYVILDTLSRWRSNGAIVRVDWETPAGWDYVASQKRAVDFVRALLPILPGYLPS
jgi:EpsI family protein